VPGLWRRSPLHPQVAALAEAPRAVAPSEREALAAGDVLSALRLLLDALASGGGYRDTVLATVNLGLDADANGALVGGFAGAAEGAASLPAHWVADLVDAARMGRLADGLLAVALGRIVAD
jgi:ADP-ribosylglycohydrolase